MGLAASRQEAFWEACGFGDKIKVKKFIAEGIDVNWVSYTHNSCPIHVASQGKKEIVQMLLDAKCNIDARDDRGNSALHHAAMNGHADIIEMLIKAGSDVDAQDKNGWTPLINAAYFCKLGAVKVLLENNCSVLIQNQDMRSALHEACRSPSNNDNDLEKIAQLLIEAGGDLNSKSSDKGEADFTPLMFCAYHGHPKVAQALIQAGCEINAQGSNKWTALHWAADRNHLEVAKVLVYSGIDVLVKGMRGELAMDRAQSKELYSLLHKSVEDASYNFNDPDGDDHSKLKDISNRIFKTADAHKHMLRKLGISSLFNEENMEAQYNVEQQLQMLEDEDFSSATATSTATDVDDEGGDDKDLSTFDPESKVNKREQHRFSTNSASRLSLILNNSISPFSSPPPRLIDDDDDDGGLNKRRNMKGGSPISPVVGFKNISSGNINVSAGAKQMNGYVK